MCNMSATWRGKRFVWTCWVHTRLPSPTRTSIALVAFKTSLEPQADVLEQIRPNHAMTTASSRLPKALQKLYGNALDRMNCSTEKWDSLSKACGNSSTDIGAMCSRVGRWDEMWQELVPPRSRAPQACRWVGSRRL